MTVETTKICSRCKKEKDLTLFKTDKRTKDGKASECKACIMSDITYLSYMAYSRFRDKRKKYRRGVNVTLEDVRNLFETFGDVCVGCARKLDGETPSLDHVIPLLRGEDRFTNHASNLFILCRSCNAKKGNRPFLTFQKEQTRFADSTLDLVIEYLAVASGLDAEMIRKRLENDVQRYELESEMKANERKSTD